MRSPDRGGGAAGATVVLAVLVAACTPAAKSGWSAGATEPEAAGSLIAALDGDSAPVPAGVLRVRLAFPSGADLDLFVTDPAQETVYFANSPSRAGGRLERDVRCDEVGPRIETVVFPDARPGRYRVGVDYPRMCDGFRGEVPFVVVVDGLEGPETRRGRATPLIFQPIVLEVVR